MAEVGDKLIAAIRATNTERRGQRRRVAWLAGAGASYAADAVGSPGTELEFAL